MLILWLGHGTPQHVVNIWKTDSAVVTLNNFSRQAIDRLSRLPFPFPAPGSIRGLSKKRFQLDQPSKSAFWSQESFTDTDPCLWYRPSYRRREPIRTPGSQPRPSRLRRTSRDIQMTTVGQKERRRKEKTNGARVLTASGARDEPTGLDEGPCLRVTRLRTSVLESVSFLCYVPKLQDFSTCRDSAVRLSHYYTQLVIFELAVEL